MLLLLLDYFKTEGWEKRWGTTHMQKETHLFPLYSSLLLKFTVVINQSMGKLLYVISICLGKAVLGRCVKAVIIFLPLAVWSLGYTF